MQGGFKLVLGRQLANDKVPGHAIGPRLKGKKNIVGASAFTSVEEYIAVQPQAARIALEQVRGAIRRALPNAQEVISYKMPAYKLHGEIVLYFAAWKHHYSLYPAGERLVAAFKKQLASCKLSKGTIRFPLSDPVPIKLIEAIARFRAEEAVRLVQHPIKSSKSRNRNEL